MHTRGERPHLAQASSVGPGVRALKALDSEKDSHCPRVSQRSRGQPSPTLPWLQAQKQSPAWTGEGHHLEEGQAGGSERWVCWCSQQGPLEDKVGGAQKWPSGAMT